MELDRIDRKILAILQEDGRIANVELAERIGLSPTSIGERLKRLQREGFIEGYGARLNPHRLGLGLLVFLGDTLLSMPGVRETRTYAVMEEIKRDAPLPVD